jgi:hypothetical protein
MFAVVGLFGETRGKGKRIRECTEIHSIQEDITKCTASC